VADVDGGASPGDAWKQNDSSEVVHFLLTSEIIPLCLRIMETGSELSKTVCSAAGGGFGKGLAGAYTNRPCGIRARLRPGGHLHCTKDPAGRHGPELCVPDVRALPGRGVGVQHDGRPAGGAPGAAAAQARDPVLLPPLGQPAVGAPLASKCALRVCKRGS